MFVSVWRRLLSLAEIHTSHGDEMLESTLFEMTHLFTVTGQILSFTRDGTIFLDAFIDGDHCLTEMA